jgi:hypothetical protein
VMFVPAVEQCRQRPAVNENVWHLNARERPA